MKKFKTNLSYQIISMVIVLLITTSVDGNNLNSNHFSKGKDDKSKETVSIIIVNPDVKKPIEEDGPILSQPSKGENPKTPTLQENNNIELPLQKNIKQ